jgi:hypothetical protein
MSSVHLITGKGGTGRTTFSLALGLGWAARGLRTLVVELGADGGLARAAGLANLDTPCLVRPRCTLASLATQPALTAFLEAHLPSRRLARIASSNTMLTTLFGAAPGTVEVAQLDALLRFSSEGQYDRVVIDGEASGHTLLLLELPRVFAGLGAGGVLGDRLARIDAMLHDPDRFVVHVATLPRDLVENETRDLAVGLARLGVHRGALLARVELDDGLSLPELELACEACEGTVAAEDLAFERAVHAHAAQLDRLGRDASTGFSRLVRVPLTERLDLGSLEELGAEVLRMLEPS